MKRFIGIILIIGMLAAFPAWAASPAACTQTLTAYGPNMKELVFTCTATGTAFAATATSTENTAAIKGWYLTEVRTSPVIGTAPTAGTTVTLMSSDTPSVDLLGGVATCSDTVTTRFVPKLNATASIYGGASIRGAVTHTIGTSAAGGVIITKYILWNN